MLTNKILDAAKGQAKQYKLYDAQGLYIVITPRNIKSWRTNYKFQGKHKTKVFGLYPDITLAKARLLNAEFKDLIASGLMKKIPTFDDLKIDWYKFKLPSLKNTKHKQQVIYRVDTFISPKIGQLPIDTIKRAQFVDVIKSVQDSGIIETAHRVATLIRQIMDYAVDLGLIENHSAAGLSRVLNTPKVKHMPCIPSDEAGTLFKAINDYDEPITKYGLMLLALTFVRTSELRFMQWSEIKDGAFWVIPPERMKMNKPHVVPLSKFTMDIIESLRVHTGDFKYVLESPKRRNHPICENTLLFALYRLGYRGLMTGHGFRALASTVLNEQSGYHSDVIERQLAHKESDAVRAAYNRAEYLDERIKMMCWWSNWIQNCLR